jgi:serine/threonine-protein kinase
MLARRALAENPLNAFWQDWLASYLGALGRFGDAEAAARKSVMLDPQQPLSYRELTYVEVLKGDAKAALAAAQRVPQGRNHDIATAWASQLGTDRAAADAALQYLIDKHAGDSSYQIAEVYALRRDPDNMFKLLDHAWANRDNGIQYLLYDPLVLRYQSDPRFAAFCGKVGLPTTTDAKGSQ